MFFSRKKPARSYDPATQQPALRARYGIPPECPLKKIY